MKKNHNFKFDIIFLSLKIFLLFFCLTLTAQAQIQAISYTYGSPPNGPCNFTVTKNVGFTISIGNPKSLTPDQITAFRTKTIIWYKSNKDSIHYTLDSLLAFLTGKPVKDTLSKVGGLIVFGDLSKLEADSINIVPFLGIEQSISPCKVKFGAGAKPGNTPCPSFIDSSMFVNQLNPGVDPYIAFDKLKIHNANTHKYKISPDYLIIYDYATGLYYPFKRIIKKDPNFKNGNADSLKYIGYFKYIRAAWFSPSVGSQLKFEVINKPISDNLSLTASYGDLFIDQANSFSSVLNSQVNKTIGTVGGLNNSTTDTNKKPSAAAATTNFLPCLTLLKNNLDYYINNFDVSSYSLAQHRANLITLQNKINNAFQLHNVDVIQGLKDKFSKDTTLTSILAGVTADLTLMENSKPLFYSTLKLRNRDTLNISLKDATTGETKNDNIRLSFGLKIDYSTGVFLTGLKDLSYVYQNSTVSYTPSHIVLSSLGKDSVIKSATKDTSGGIIVRQKTDRANVGFGFLMHVYPRLTSNYNLGITAGFMSTTNVDLNILLGGSFMFQSIFGSNNRLALNAGMAWGKVARLSAGYQESYNNLPSYDDTGKPIFYTITAAPPPVVQVWDMSWFFGMSFNFK